MKTNNNNFTSKFALAVFLALGTLAVTSCQKEKSQTEEIIPDGKNQVIVRVSGISDSESIASSGAKSSTGGNKTSKQNTFKLIEGEGFDALVGVDNGASATSGLKAASGSRAATTPLAPTTSYSIYFYKKNTDNTTYTFVKSVPLTAAAAGTINLDNGSYKWLAISYNNTEVLPVGATTTTAPTNTVLDINKDVLTASSTSDLVINGNSVPLNITFNRVFSEITVEVNTLGMFAPMTETPTISLTSPVFTKTINFTTGNLDLTPSTSINFTKSNFSNEPGVVGDSYKKIATYRTAGQPTAMTVNAKVSQLKIKLDDGSIRDFLTTQSNQNIEFTPTGGKKQRVLVGIAESALTLGSGATAVKWSRSNLYYQAGDATPYRFYHTNEKAATFDPRAYFAQGGVIPGKLALRSAQKDPCALVYPKGLWKTPTYDDIVPLTNREGLVADLLGNILDALLPTAAPGASYSSGNYIQYTGVTGKHAAYGSTTSAANASNNLRFNYNGVVPKISAVNRLITINSVPSFGQQAAFWTNSTITNYTIPSLLNLNLDVLVSLGAWSYMGNNRSLLSTGLFPRAVAVKGLGVLDNVTLLGSIEVLNSDLMNVRCVRTPDATWNTVSKAPGYDPMPDLSQIND